MREKKRTREADERSFTDEIVIVDDDAAKEFMLFNRSIMKDQLETLRLAW